MFTVAYFRDSEILRLQLPHHSHPMYLKTHYQPKSCAIYNNRDDNFLFALIVLLNDETYALTIDNRIYLVNDSEYELLRSFEILLDPLWLDIDFTQSSAPVLAAKGLLPISSFASIAKQLFNRNIVAWHLIPESESPTGVYHVIRTGLSESHLQPTIVPAGTPFELEANLFTGTLKSSQRILLEIFKNQNIQNIRSH
jgi:hypothetical protein